MLHYCSSLYMETVFTEWARTWAGERTCAKAQLEMKKQQISLCDCKIYSKGNLASSGVQRGLSTWLRAVTVDNCGLFSILESVKERMVGARGREATTSLEADTLGGSRRNPGKKNLWLQLGRYPFGLQSKLLRSLHASSLLRACLND